MARCSKSKFASALKRLANERYEAVKAPMRPPGLCNPAQESGECLIVPAKSCCGFVKYDREKACSRGMGGG
jgi:hypothetical protein